MLISARLQPLALFRRDDVLVGKFTAMNCSCEILMDTDDLALGHHLLKIASDEAWRIEKKFSRYNNENIIHAINTSEGRSVTVDTETAHLIDFADRCYSLSEGLFDVTSGLLRRAWTFDGSDRVPSVETVKALLPRIGWSRVSWKSPVITLPTGMEIDLGGIGKEYAVDRALVLVGKKSDIPILINYGGDIAVSGFRKSGAPWSVGIESALVDNQAVKTIFIKQGAVATSGDAKKFLLKDGIRYGHILNPRTGWPVLDAPRSVTVAAATCTEAGFLSTLGILNGKNAAAILGAAGVPYWCT